jgi:hypothetical protein
VGLERPLRAVLSWNPGGGAADALPGRTASVAAAAAAQRQNVGNRTYMAYPSEGCLVNARRG